MQGTEADETWTELHTALVERAMADHQAAVWLLARSAAFLNVAQLEYVWGERRRYEETVVRERGA